MFLREQYFFIWWSWRDIVGKLFLPTVKPLESPWPDAKKFVEQNRAVGLGIAGPAISVPGVSEKMFNVMTEALFGSENVDVEWRGDHGCQMTIARFSDRMCLALRASGLWLRYAMLQNLIPSFPWIAPGWRAWGRNPRKGRDQILQRSVAEP